MEISERLMEKLVNGVVTEVSKSSIVIQGYNPETEEHEYYRVSIDDGTIGRAFV